MDRQELVQRYKGLPGWIRVLCAVLPAILYGAYLYIEDGSRLETELEGARDQEVMAKNQFEQARRKKADIPQWESKLAFTNEQLDSARRQLPDEIHMEEILQKVASLARDSGVHLGLFKPGTETEMGDTVRYMEVPIKLDLSGRFSQVASFFDRIVHLDKMIHVRNPSFLPERAQKDPEKANATPESAAEALEPELDLAGMLKVSVDLVVFRSLRDGEGSSAVASPGAATGAAANPGAAGAPPAGQTTTPGAAPAAPVGG